MQNPYNGTQGVHPGIDYFNGEADPLSAVVSLCDGIVISARIDNPGGSAGGGIGVAVRCFAPDNGDPDNNGEINLSNTVITYNHMSSRFVEYQLPDGNSFIFVSEGTVLGQTNSTLPPGINHLHLEVFIRGEDVQIPLLYGYRDGIGSIRINPLLMFERMLAEEHISLLGDNSPFPYYPFYQDISTLRPVDLRIDPRYIRISNLGLDVDDLDAMTLESDLSVTGRSFWDIQIPDPQGVIEWPMNRIGQADLRTLLSLSGEDNLTLIAHLERFYPPGSNYYTDSGETLNCVGVGFVVGMVTAPGTITTNVVCD